MAEGVQKVRPGMTVTPEAVMSTKLKGEQRSNRHVQILHQPAHRGDGDCHPHGDRRRGHDGQLPVAQFPKLLRRKFSSATYVGADAQTIEQSVATPIEQQMSGVDNMNYMYSVNATTTA